MREKRAIDKTFDEAMLQLQIDGALFYLLACMSKMDTAMEVLTNGGFPVYCPKVQVMKPPPLRTLKPSQRPFAYMMARPVNVPLFPGYFLVGLGERRDPHEIFKLCGTEHVGMRAENGEAVPLRKSYIERIRKLEADGAIPSNTPLKLLLDVGDLVRVLDGPFAGWTGTVEDLGELALGKLDETARLGICLTIFGRETPVSVQLAQVAKV